MNKPILTRRGSTFREPLTGTYHISNGMMFSYSYEHRFLHVQLSDGKVGSKLRTVMNRKVIGEQNGTIKDEQVLLELDKLLKDIEWNEDGTWKIINKRLWEEYSQLVEGEFNRNVILKEVQDAYKKKTKKLYKEAEEYFEADIKKHLKDKDYLRSQRDKFKKENIEYIEENTRLNKLYNVPHINEKQYPAVLPDYYLEKEYHDGKIIRFQDFSYLRLRPHLMASGLMNISIEERDHSFLKNIFKPAWKVVNDFESFNTNAPIRPELQRIWDMFLKTLPDIPLDEQGGPITTWNNVEIEERETQF